MLQRRIENLVPIRSAVGPMQPGDTVREVSAILGIVVSLMLLGCLIAAGTEFAGQARTTASFLAW